MKGRHRTLNRDGMVNFANGLSGMDAHVMHVNASILRMLAKRLEFAKSSYM